MSDIIKSTGTFTVTINGNVSAFTGDCTVNLTKTGSNAVAEVKNISSGSWQALTTSSLSDMRYMYFSNEGTASIIIAADSAGTKVLTTLEPDDSSVISWKSTIASIPLYANITSAYPTSGSVLYYILSES